jgi:WD40 repeat protein
MSLTRLVFVLAIVVASQDFVREQVPSRVPVIKDTSGDPLPSGAFARLGARDAGNKESADRAFTLAFSDDGRRMLAGGLDSVMLYAVDGKKPPLRLTLADGKGEVKDKQFACTLAFSSDGKRAAAGWADGSVGVWEATGGKRLWEKREHEGFVLSLMFASGDRILLSTGAGDVRWWDASAGQMRRHFKLPSPERFMLPPPILLSPLEPKRFWPCNSIPKLRENGSLQRVKCAAI